jgi:hypothetical protein
MTTVWVYVDTGKQVCDRDHLKVFANSDAADAWFAKHDPEGVAFEYEVIDEWPTFEAEIRRQICATETEPVSFRTTLWCG